jgi:hypothetical protein
MNFVWLNLHQQKHENNSTKWQHDRHLPNHPSPFQSTNIDNKVVVLVEMQDHVK